MRQLRLVGVDDEGRNVVLAGADGERFTLPVDDMLRAAVQGDRARLGRLTAEGESRLRPRDIQARIRAGQTAEEVAAAAGVPVERVRRFEGPVLAERQHVATLAQRAPVKGQGETSGPPLGELVAERMGWRATDEQPPEWDSWRLDDHQWQVNVCWDDHGTERTATWVYDTARRCVVPDDDTARELLTRAAEQADAADDGGDVRPFRPRLATSPRQEPERPRHEAPAGVTDPAPAATATQAAPVPAAADRSDTPRARPPRGPRDRRRVAVPSWDEILLGRKPPD